MNTVVLLGRATNSIELKQTQAGKSVATFSIAVKRPFTKDTTDFYNVTVWDKQAELLSRYVNKGDQICIRGYLQTRSWTDNNGQKRTVTEVVASEATFCEAKRESEGNSAPTYSNGSQGKFESSPYIPQAYTDSDLPF